MSSLSASRSFREPLMLMAPGVLFLLLSFLLPTLHMLALSGISSDPAQAVSLTLDHYAKFFEDSYYIGIAARTFRLSVLISVVCLLLGYPLAMVMVQAGPRLRKLLIILVITPLMTSVVIRTFGWLVILGYGGLLSDLLQVIGVVSRGLSLMHTESGIVIAMVQVLLPFMTLTVLGSLSRIDPRLDEASRTMGAGFFRTLWHVKLPLSVPGIVSGTLLTFALSISSFITPALVGGVRLPMMAGSIYQQVTGSFDWGFASAQSVLLLVASLFVITPYLAFVRTKGK